MKALRILSLLVLGWGVALTSGCQTGATSSVADSTATSATDPDNVLKIGVTPDMAPMVFKQGGELTGFEIEMGRALGGHLDRPVKFVEVSWNDQLTALQSGRTDIVMSSMSITPERSMLVAFSNPYMRVGQMLLVQRTDLYQYALGIPQPLPGVVGVQKGTVGEYLIESQFSRSKVKKFNSVEDAVADLARKRIQSVVSDAQIMWYQAAVNESNGLSVVPRMLREDSLGWAVRNTDRELLNQVNEFVGAIGENGTMAEAMRRWLPLAR